MSSVIRRRFCVWGRVQGVFYRASTQQKAQQLGLDGWVRNTEQGAVECEAQAQAPVLDSFEAWLWQGPTQAKVTRVDKCDIEIEAEKAAPLFEVRY